MSAFVVSRKTIDHVVTAILATGKPFAGVQTYTESHYGGRFPFVQTSASTRADNGELTQEAATKIGRALYAMNEDAVEERYEDRARDYFGLECEEARFYSFTEVTRLSRVQAFKSLSCLLYQCSEGTIDQTPLFKELERVKERARVRHHS